MADERARFEWRAFNTSLTTRILAVNLIPLILLAGSLFFLDSYRRQLLNERFNLARIEAQITAEALAGASRTRQEALLIQIGREQRMRLRMFDAEGDFQLFARPEPGGKGRRQWKLRILDGRGPIRHGSASFVANRNPRAGHVQVELVLDPREGDQHALALFAVGIFDEERH